MDQIEKKDLQLSTDTTDVVISDIVRRIVILEQLVRVLLDDVETLWKGDYDT